MYVLLYLQASKVQKDSFRIILCLIQRYCVAEQFYFHYF